ncbi:MAG: acetyl-CoA carboxylase biotin carboxylase subunit [Nitrospirae bacterium RBG_19FT_COMBO_42_15]|nr:MAG: acetyl-CoA carboxylase biotin carboxylase subunit [Nitrospirae bacterium RBG_19FT_COMBO_42_15]
MFKKVLIANRGEIALRIIRACKELKIATVAIHSEADATTLYVKKADESCLVGPGPLSGYLNIYKIIEIAKQRGVDAIHPGYGFLAENPEFAKSCEENNITFIGPSSDAVHKLGNKIVSRQIMKKAGIPIVPGTMEKMNSEDEAAAEANRLGYPVMLKAAAGGGGRGLRICRNDEELRRFLPIAKKESLSAFGDEDVYLEKCLEAPRHIEFQIVADNYGNVIHLGERDCSIQRRHQKLVEIAPSLLLDDKLRQEMGAAAIAAAKAANYNNVGTVEFLIDKNKNFYFLEMNTRIQVEHTVTEEVTGIDIVREMIRIARGERLSIKQEDVKIRGYAIECRINAEDPKNNFIPTTGRVTAYYSPGGIGVRIDGNVYVGYTIPTYYDSMLAKLTVRGRTWEETVDRMYRCLDEYVIRGVKTTIPFYKRIMLDENFKKGEFNTNYIDEKIEELVYQDERDPKDLVLAISAAIVAHSGL